MHYDRIYSFRFKGVDPASKLIVWNELAHWVHENHLKRAQRVLDPAGGMCEFINAVPAKERWTIDINEEFIRKSAAKDVKLLIGSNLEVDLPKNYFDGVFISNFLEHLHTQEEVALLLERLYEAMAPGGRIVIMGPNFKFLQKEYFDCADHTVILTEQGVAEHLYGAGFELMKVYPKFLPFSFRSGRLLPVSSFTIRTYLNMPLAWKVMGKQFLLVAEKP